MIARSFLLVSVVLAVASSQVAVACDQGEWIRLSDEQRKLANRNAWTGVERAYQAMVRTGCTLTAPEHVLGGEAARHLGNTLNYVERLQSAQQVTADPGIAGQIELVGRRFGRVRIVAKPRKPPELVPVEMPFAPEERSSIQYAQRQMADTGSFDGLLPLGNYQVGGEPFEVRRGGGVVEVILTDQKVRSSRPQPGAGTGRYVGPVASIGPSLFLSPAPNEPTTLPDGGHELSPSNLTLLGLAAVGGVEVGVANRVAVAGTVGYLGGVGRATMHGVSGAVSGVLRLNNWRVALGPQAQVVFGRGTGVADWFDRGQPDPVEDVPFAGRAWGPGVAGSVGLAVRDFDAVQGVVEVGGSWQSDGARNYAGVALRVGLVPTASR